LPQIDGAALGGEARHGLENGGAEAGVDAVHDPAMLAPGRGRCIQRRRSRRLRFQEPLNGEPFMKRVIAAALLAAVIAAPAAAQTRPFDPREYQRQHVGAPTQVLVLGTMHLSGTPETFDPAVLDPLLDRLAAFAPDAITIEALPG